MLREVGPLVSVPPGELLFRQLSGWSEDSCSAGGVRRLSTRPGVDSEDAMVVVIVEQYAGSGCSCWVLVQIVRSYCCNSCAEWCDSYSSREMKETERTGAPAVTSWLGEWGVKS